MKQLLSFLLIFCATITTHAQVTTDVPAKVEKNKKYLFYLHGAIVQSQGENAVSPAYGKYMYRAIVDSFSRYGYHVISEVRPKDADGGDYARKVAAQVKKLMDKGVPASHIIIVGASAGGSIAMNTADVLSNPDINYALMGVHAGGAIKICGNFFSVYEQSDATGQLAEYFKGKPCVKGFKEIMLNMGNGHGFLYQPYKEWLHPMMQWAGNASK